MTSVHPSAFVLPYTVDTMGDSGPALAKTKRISPAATLAVLVASSFAIWLGVLLLLLT